MAKSKGVTIDKSDWESLSEVEREMMKKLGITVAKDKSDLTQALRKSIAPDSYILGVTEECRLCGEVYYYLYEMMPEEVESGSYLKAVELPLGSAKPTRASVRYRLTCRTCETRLREWPRKELISKLIEFADMPTTKLKQRIAARAALQQERESLTAELSAAINSNGAKKESKNEHLAGVDKEGTNRIKRRRSILYTG